MTFINTNLCRGAEVQQHNPPDILDVFLQHHRGKITTNVALHLVGRFQVGELTTNQWESENSRPMRNNNTNVVLGGIHEPPMRRRALLPAA